jgi:glycosyltransferase involved in cell wall biosynthesis
VKRVLHLISQLEEGGAQRMLSNILERATHFDMQVASLIGSERARLMPYFRAAKFPIHYMSHSNDFYSPEILANLKRLIIKEQFDLVHCWLFQAIVQGTIICRHLRIPCIADPQIMRNIILFGNHHKWEQFLIKKVMQRSDLVVFNSTSAALDFVEAGVANGDYVRVVRSGVDCDYFQPFETEGNFLVCIGRVAAEKGYQDLEAIVKQLQLEFSDLHCLAAGSGNPPQNSVVEFIGHTDDVREFLAKGCIYISTSYAEGLSNALLEAQACGLPAIARNIGPNAEVIEHGTTGLLCETNEDFIHAVKTLWTNPGLRKKMAKNARMRMETRFSMTERINEFESLYLELL